jgi:cell division protein FtsB
MREPGRLAAPLIYAAVALAVAALGWSGLNDDRGLAALAAAEAERARLEAELAGLRAERRAAENRVARLGRDYLDLDLLDERARAVLGYVRPDEVVIRPVAR